MSNLIKKIALPTLLISSLILTGCLSSKKHTEDDYIADMQVLDRIVLSSLDIIQNNNNRGIEPCQNVNDLSHCEVDFDNEILRIGIDSRITDMKFSLTVEGDNIKCFITPEEARFANRNHRCFD